MKQLEEGGWAASDFALNNLLTCVPEWPGDPDPAMAVVEAFAPPHPYALPGDLLDRVLTAAGSARPRASGNGTYYEQLMLSDVDRAAVFAPFVHANDLWWRLDLDEWVLGVKHYTRGERHPAHQDLHPGIGARRKLAGVVMLSDPDEYTGGNLVMQYAHHRIPMPKARGTVVAMPGWTVHEVEPVTSGERWSLCVNGRGPTLR